MADVDKWEKLRTIVEQAVENVVRRVVREEIAVLQKPTKNKVGFKNGMFTGLGEIEMAALEAAYPAVNALQEIKEAAAWIVTHPNDAPRSNYGAFLNSWLKKHQDRHALRSIPMAKPASIVPSLCEYCGLPSIGAIGGRRHCRAHAQNAMDGEQPPKFMPGVIAKQVAGRD